MARPAGDIDKRVLVAARARFLADGVEGASLRAIARDAGTNLGMVYYYFPTKDALFMAVVEEVYARLLSDIAAVLAASGPELAKQVEALFTRLAELSDEEAEVLGLVMREAVGSSSRITGLFERFERGHIGLLMGLFGQAQAKGEVRPELSPFVVMVGTMAAGLVPQMIRRRLVAARVPVSAMLPDSKQLARMLADLVLRGVSNGVENIG